MMSNIIFMVHEVIYIPSAPLRNWPSPHVPSGRGSGTPRGVTPPAQKFLVGARLLECSWDASGTFGGRVWGVVGASWLPEDLWTPLGMHVGQSYARPGGHLGRPEPSWSTSGDDLGSKCDKKMF